LEHNIAIGLLTGLATAKKSAGGLNYIALKKVTSGQCP